MTSTSPFLPTGKLPPDLLAKIIARAPSDDPRIILGPAPGLDCAVVEASPDLLVFKSDPITFATQEIGWYAVQISTNDIATTGATPRWLLATCLLPAGSSTPELVESIASQLYEACRQKGISVIGGHTEVTHGISHPILVATVIGEVAREKLVTPRGANPGDLLLLTKQIPIEATALLAREFPDTLREVLDQSALERAQHYLHDPGLSVLPEARAAVLTGGVTAMHDPTEGGLNTALWELAEACGCSLEVTLEKVPISALSRRICETFNLNPLAAIASGALLLAVTPEACEDIRESIEKLGIQCTQIGTVGAGPATVWVTNANSKSILPRPARDEIAQLFE